MKYLKSLMFWKNRRIRFDILTGFVLLLSLTTFSIIYYTYDRLSDLFINFSHNLIENVSQTTVEQTTRFIEPARKMAVLMSAIVQKKEDINPQNKRAIQLMVRALKSYPQLNALYLSNEDGDFLQVARIVGIVNYKTQAKILPSAARYFVRYVTFAGPQPTETWYYLNEASHILDSELNTFVQYDPRLRPWYISVRETNRFSWSDVYKFATNNKIGMTASYPLLTERTHLLGVVGVDVVMESISDFMENIQIAEEAVAFILNDQGEVISYPESQENFIEDSDGISLMTVNQLARKELLAAYQRYQQPDQSNHFIFSESSVRYIASFKAFPEDFGKQWYVCIVVPVKSFLGIIDSTQWNTVLISLTILLLGILLSVLWSRKLSMPIVQLAHEADKLRRFKMDTPVVIRSNIHEIQLLSDAMTAMRKSIISFSKFVPKNLVSKLVQRATEVKVGGRNRTITLMFTDIADFTSTTESYPQDKLMDHLSEYFEELTKIITVNQGTIDKYIGDAIMAFWGAPTYDKDQAIHGCIAALLCQRKLQDLNRRWLSENKPQFFTRIGLHIGDVIVGNVGSSDRINYTAIGDAVNIAARLENLNKYYDSKIIISETLYEQVEKSVTVRPLDIVAVKGRTTGEKIYELLGLKMPRNKNESILLPSERDIELSNTVTRAFQCYLEQRWEEAHEHYQYAAQIRESDKSIQLMIQRCQQFQKDPPPSDWDGLIHMATK